MTQQLSIFQLCIQPVCLTFSLPMSLSVKPLPFFFAFNWAFCFLICLHRIVRLILTFKKLLTVKKSFLNYVLIFYQLWSRNVHIFWSNFSICWNFWALSPTKSLYIVDISKNLDNLESINWNFEPAKFQMKKSQLKKSGPRWHKSLSQQSRKILLLLKPCVALGD